MRDRGWEVEGVEASDAARIPAGFTVHRVPFRSGSGFSASSFDVITAWAVFEHLHDPADAFAECARLLRPDGLLIAQVPNLDSVFGRFSRQEDIPRHLYFFSPLTLRQYAARSGLALERIVHTTDLFGGSGRGVLRLLLTHAVGGSTQSYFDFLALKRPERFRRRPLFAAAWHAAATVERLVLADRVVRTARISGQIVAMFRRAPAGGELS